MRAVPGHLQVANYQNTHGKKRVLIVAWSRQNGEDRGTGTDDEA
jgi:hypothetical protein